VPKFSVARPEEGIESGSGPGERDTSETSSRAKRRAKASRGSGDPGDCGVRGTSVAPAVISTATGRAYVKSAGPKLSVPGYMVFT
jgi:hypothetical protein